MSLRSPLGRVLGLGSAKSGTDHWWLQRVSSVALIPLTLWFLIAMLRLPDLQYATAYAWLAAPFTGFLSILLVVALAHHSYLGVTVVVEDYVHGAGSKILTLLLLRFAHLTAGAAAVFAILRVVFGAAAP